MLDIAVDDKRTVSKNMQLYVNVDHRYRALNNSILASILSNNYNSILASKLSNKYPLLVALPQEV